MTNFQIPNTDWLRIGDKIQVKEPVLIYYRRQFTAEKTYETYKLNVSADSRYKLYVNGCLAEVGPAKGDNKVWYVDTVDIASWIVPGSNVIAAEVLVYPYAEEYNHSIYSTNRPGLYIQDTEEDGLVRIGEGNWKCYAEKDFHIVRESPFFAPMCILENRRGDSSTLGWKETGYDDSAWETARPYNIMEISRSSVPGDLTPRTIPFLFLRPEKFSGVKKIRTSLLSKEEWDGLVTDEKMLVIPAHTKEIIEFDAGEELTAYLSLRVTGGKGSSIRIKTAESYVADDENKNADLFFTHPTKGDRSDAEHGVLHGFTDTYQVAGAGRDKSIECYEPFWFRTFRYVQLHITTGEEALTLCGFDFTHTGYPLEVSSSVKTSDESLDSIWDISLRSLKNCMHETYEDCPFYEQLQYAMDSRSQILYTYAVSGDDRLARKCMDDFRRSQRFDGMLNSSCPTTRANVIPGFSIYYILMLDDHMMYFGDKELLRKHAAAVDGVLEYFRRNLDDRGLVGKNGGLNVIDRYWSFIDWTTQWDATTGVPDAILSGPITMESFLYIMGLTAAARINAYIGRGGMAKEYEQRAEEVKKAVNHYCRSENGMYQDGPGVDKISQHCQVFAILTDTVSEEEGAKYLKETMKEKEQYAQCSVAMAFYLFRAMEKVGLYEEMNNCWEPWRNMVRLNLTTCVEDHVNQRSDCHAWGAAVLYELPAVTLGVKPGAPGYGKIVIRPVAGYLDWAQGEVVTKWGKVSVKWCKNTDGTLSLEYKAPEGVEIITDIK